MFDKYEKLSEIVNIESIKFDLFEMGNMNEEKVLELNKMIDRDFLEYIIENDYMTFEEMIEHI